MKPTKPSEPQARATDQRRRAEESLQAQAQSAAVQPSVLHIQKLLHELQVHQIELEMQNEELRQSQAETKTALARYTDLYDVAPAGYFTLQPDGAITQLNLAGARLLGRERELLTGKRFGAFVSQADLPVFKDLLQQVFVSEIDPSCEVDLLSVGQPLRSVRIEATRSPDERDCRVVVLDITERKRADQQLRDSRTKASELADLLSTVLESPHGLVVFALDLNYCYTTFTATHKAVMKTIWNVDIAVGVNMLDSITDLSDRNKAKRNFDQALAGSFLTIIEEYGEPPNRFFYDNRYSPIVDMAGTVRGLTVFVVDVSERKQAEELLRQSAARTSRIVRAAALGLWEWNLLTDEVYFSPEWKGQLGYADDEFANRFDEWQKRVHPEDRPRVLAAVSDFRAGRTQRYAIELRMMHLDGFWRWMYGEAELERNDSGEPVSIMGSQIDITERKQMALREATHSQTMTALAGGTPLTEVLTALVRGIEGEHTGTLGCVSLIDATGAHLLTGAAPSLPAFYIEALHGVAIGPAVGSCGTAAFTGERVLVTDIQTDPLWTNYKALAAQAGLAACWSEPIRGTRGRVLGAFAIYRAQPHLPSEAEIGCIVAAAQLAAVAIERTQANEALRRSTQLLEASQSTAKTGGWELDLSTSQLFWTAETYRLHDTSPEEFNPTVDAGVGFYLPESRRIISAALQTAMESGVGYDLVLETLTTKGRLINVRTTCTVTLENGRPVKLTGIFQDITARKQAEAQREHLLQTLNTRNEELDAYNFSVAHDLRNPVISIRGMTDVAEIALDRGDIDKARACLTRVAKSANQADTLIRKLMEVAKHGNRALNFAALPARATVGRIVTSFDLLTDSDPETVSIEIDEQLEIWADEALLGVIITNLVSNAIRYRHPERAPKVRLLAQASTAPNGVMLKVYDNGIGIESVAHTRVFRLFERVSAGSEGTGVGLALVDRAARQMGGRAELAESTPGVGSCFSVWLPAAPK